MNNNLLIYLVIVIILIVVTIILFKYTNTNIKSPFEKFFQTSSSEVNGNKELRCSLK